MPVKLFWGEEEFNLEEAVVKLKEQVLDPTWAGLNHKILRNPTISGLIEALETIPMAFGNLLIEVRTDNLFSRGGKSGSEDEIKRLINAIENLPNNVYVLFITLIPRESGKKVDSVLKTTKAVARVGEIQEFPAFKLYQEDKIKAWIKQKAAEKDIKVSDDAALALIHSTGAELRKLDLELEKLQLCIYPNKTVNVSNVEELCSDHENLFLFADLLIKGDKIQAAIELNKLYEKNHPLKIIATLQSFLKKWIKIKIEAEVKNSFEIARLLNQSEYVVKKDLERLGKIRLPALVCLKDRLTKAEFMIKSGELSAEMSLELVVIS